ncbi:MAG: mobile mystery protein A [Candidatus Thioglobus sp.]|jgi:predicted DNA-binding mobile mystery protein A|uniref:mobile mystery protein A n=1 Tax=Candidatus Thioglobus sp. TaxID=2026721 RepID=UPI001DC09B5B|nr:mobile mystery protein A [Candidatus Thioglobus sp.]MBT3187110.1 mobile mystery protein A [Candidatus Thioglobus sp.]MBT3431215.1 mobile mystery protein A [Candidatus Thioglobus sp.]MBT4316556.1 mobile mystery protein A [Candidatus Thioglobus sp.]MBT4553027.1 mobile mystery protein A [Candidatus Thioglobus sp.]MBT5784314.1 mobile mystery protein A [Candidatus Thioglobus sp.]
MMNKLIRSQYQSKINLTTSVDVSKIARPKEGWIRTLRKSLGMSANQLAKYLDMSSSQATQMERMEAEDRITIKQLRRVANVLNCDLEYAIIPRKPVESTITEQAKIKAQELISKVDDQMRLEDQQLSKAQLTEQLEIEIDRLVEEMPRTLWDK